MIEKIVKYIPPTVRANKICRRTYWAFMDYIEIPLRKCPHSLRRWLKEWLYYVHYGYKLRKFKDIHKGKRCFIIGNGPSILQQDLTKLKNETTFVTNRFVLHEQYDEINPTYYCVADEKIFSVSDTNIQFHQLLVEKTKNAVKFFPLWAKSFVDRQKLYVGHQVFYLNIPPSMTIWVIGSMSLDITKVIYTAPTVIIDPCLPLAFYMGFSEIYLLGCDSDFPKGEKVHFYGAGCRTIPADRDYEEWINGWYNDAMKSYSIVKETFERHGRKIYNAGVGGKLEVFERVDYDELFKTNQA